jgi:hypothetical protein
MVGGVAGYTLNTNKTHFTGSANGEEAFVLFPGPLTARILRVTVEGVLVAGLVEVLFKRIGLRANPLVAASPGSRAPSTFTPSSGVRSQALVVVPSGAGNGSAFWGAGVPGAPGFYTTGGDSGSNGAAIQQRAMILLSDDNSGQCDWSCVRFEYAY